MKVTEQQVIIMHQTLVESLKIGDRGFLFTYDRETRGKVADAVFAQSASVVIDTAAVQSPGKDHPSTDSSQGGQS